ncbi:hypothetical protein T484DRAFT_1746805 [Baffinella frigidus]|nr:hypothetical protein T484DRAFT_1746805 [Cryptophyta sp. CCMP2293]
MIKAPIEKGLLNLKTELSLKRTSSDDAEDVAGAMGGGVKPPYAKGLAKCVEPELSLARTAIDDESGEDLAARMMKSPSEKALFQLGQFMPVRVASADSETANFNDAPMPRVKAFDATMLSLECDTALLRQLRLSVSSVTTWRPKHEKAISNSTEDGECGMPALEGDSALLRQLHLSVSSATMWRPTHKRATEEGESTEAQPPFLHRQNSEKGSFNAAQAWDAMGRRCQANLQE